MKRTRPRRSKGIDALWSNIITEFFIQDNHSPDFSLGLRFNPTINCLPAGRQVGNTFKNKSRRTQIRYAIISHKSQNSIDKIREIEEKAAQIVCLAKEQAFNLLKQENTSAVQELENAKQQTLIQAALLIEQTKEQALQEAKTIEDQTQQALTNIENNFASKKALAKKEILHCL